MSEAPRGMRISVTDNGPYIVSGAVPLVREAIDTNEEGESVDYRHIEDIETADRYSLCRCGHSCSKPFCDGTHAMGGFDMTETAGHEAFATQAVSIDGPGVKLHDARKLCAEARFCDRAEGLWNLVGMCDDPEKLELASREAMLCPSGRYVLADQNGEHDLEPDLEPSIAVLEDPAMGVSGPLFVRSGIPISDAQGERYEVRNRVTLCRCGKSANKPFCDGAHLRTEFKDESAPEG